MRASLHSHSSRVPRRGACSWALACAWVCVPRRVRARALARCCSRACASRLEDCACLSPCVGDGYALSVLSSLRSSSPSVATLCVRWWSVRGGVCGRWLAFFTRHLICFLRSGAFFPSYVACFYWSLSSLSLFTLWAITFGALCRSRSLGRTLILRVLSRSISLGFSLLASSFVSLSLYSDNLFNNTLNPFIDYALTLFYPII